MGRRRKLSVRKLGQYEDRLLAFVTTRVGDPASRDRALERAGVYRKYAKVVEAYWRRSGDGVEGREALRRTVFLLWCSATQPCCLTGLGEINATMQDEVIYDLDRACEDGQLDAQLRWMLAYYHAQYPIVFRRFTSASALQQLLLDASGDEWRATDPTPHDFAERGLMGRFWLQVLEGG
jgi:hypothetical protein